MTPDTAALLSASLGINFRARAPPPGRLSPRQRREAVCVTSHQVPSSPSRQCLVDVMNNLLLEPWSSFLAAVIKEIFYLWGGVVGFEE